MELNNLEIYRLALELGEKIWFNVNKWEYFPKSTIGLQFVKSTDSIAANISEGFGRYHYKEKKNFSYFARGSLFESITWLEKAKNRGLIDNDSFVTLSKDFRNLAVKLNNYIKSIGSGTIK